MHPQAKERFPPPALPRSASPTADGGVLATWQRARRSASKSRSTPCESSLKTETAWTAVERELVDLSTCASTRIWNMASVHSCARRAAQHSASEEHHALPVTRGTLSSSRTYRGRVCKRSREISNRVKGVSASIFSAEEIGFLKIHGNDVRATSLPLFECVYCEHTQNLPIPRQHFRRREQRGTEDSRRREDSCRTQGECRRRLSCLAFCQRFPRRQ